MAEAYATKQTPIGDLVAFDDNPRNISHERLAALKRSLEADPEMLQARPLLALPDGRVIAGNQRLRAAQELGWPTVPSITVDIDETRARLWALRDNNQYGHWDEDQLSFMLQELSAEGADLDLAGFEPGYLDEMLRDVNGGATDPDDAPPVPAEPRSVRGEVYELGPHRLMCGDAFADLDSLLTERPTVLLTDPPYGINLDTDWTNPGGRINGRAYDRVIGDDAPFDASELVGLLPDVGEQFWFGANYYRSSLLPDDRSGSWLVWDKRTEATDSVVGSGFELIWSRAPHKQDVLRHGWTNFTSAYNAGMRREHPTEKPVALLREIIARWTTPADAVLDLFAGAGSVLIAAQQEGRRCFAMEIDPAYCDVIRQRYADYTNQPQYAP